MVDKDFAMVSRQTEDQIRVLKGLEAVRIRPGMYVGGTDSRALHHLIYEVVDNSIDEALAGRCDHITVTLHPDNYVSVADNGGGIPVGLNKDEQISTLELVLTNLHAGGKFATGAYKVSGGLHGVGVSAVNALSEELIAEVYRDGYVWRQTYRMGKPTSEVTAMRPLDAGEATGTVITFKPDFTVMDYNEFSYDALETRFREMAFVTRRVTLTLRDERTQPLPKTFTFYFEGGIRSFVRYINRNRETLHPVVGAEREVEFTPEGKEPYTIGIEFAFQYADTSNVTELAFANTINTPDGGAHLTGLRAAITSVINRYGRKAGFLKDKDANFSGSDTLEGITAIVSVKHPNPQFESQTKVKLLNAETQGAVSQVVTETFNEFLELNPREARRIIDKCMTSMRAREAARKARDLVRSGPSLLESTTLPGKLADCSQHGKGSEIYIVEGDSAGGCFSGDTRVALADGRNLSFAEIVAEQAEGKEHFIYTIRHDGKIGIEQALHARITQTNAQVMRMMLDNGESIVCTPDHRFMLYDGTYKAAAALTVQDALMPSEGSTVKSIITCDYLPEYVAVYDIEVPHTHNFALASGVFVHNSAKQGRDRHFQAILPLRGKILNTERARLDKMLDNNEIKALISALGTGIADDFNVESIRYERTIIMSVAGDEPTLVLNGNGETEFVQIGAFIDDCLAGRRDADEYQVMSFDLQQHQTRFRPLKAVIRHPHHEPMYRITTRYNRSVKVTSSHSVFVYENGQVKLKKGNEIRPGDLLVAPRQMPRPSTYPMQIDLIDLFARTGETHALYLKGECVRQIAARRVLNQVEHPNLWQEPKVEVAEGNWQKLIEHRQQSGWSQSKIATAVGVKQPITISQWERGIHHPTLPKFLAYLQTMEYTDSLDFEILPSRLETSVNTPTSKNARWRKTSDYKRFTDFTSDELLQLDEETQIVPQAHLDKAFGRFLPLTSDLLYFLGWFTAEGTLSNRQVSLNLGQKDQVQIEELTRVIETLFGETPRCYHDPDSNGIKFYFQSVLATRLLRAWGLAGRAHEKRLPHIVYNVPETLQLAFLEGYFLGNGTSSGKQIAFVTNSPHLKDGILYLFSQLGLIATVTLHQPSEGMRIQTRHPYYSLTLCGKEQLDRIRPVWKQHANAGKIESYLQQKTRDKQAFVPISTDLMGLEVISAEEIEPIGEYVYDFSVEQDENFICGVGGLCAHNTDADVDGSHIRTLLLTFFFRHMYPLIQNGHLYIAQPPIFRIQHGKEVEYLYNEAGVSESEILSRALHRYPDPDKLKISRYKGLGEMNPDQLWETTMDPARRTLLQVTIEDAVEADSVFDMLMGNNVPPRRHFIQHHAKSVRNLDI
jgi:DNA gyrase subunit B